MLLSVVVPCFNEGKVIEQSYNEITRALEEGFAGRRAFNYELVFVDDGSKDDTRKKLKAFAGRDDRVRYIAFSRNFGKEAAMLAGLSYAKGDCVVIMDADLQHPPELIPEMVRLYEEGNDQVIAKRDREGDKKLNSAFARTYYKMVNKLVDVKMDDGVGDFRLLSRKAVDAILSLQEYNRFSKGLFSWIGFKQEVLTYKNRQRAAGETKWSFRKLLSYGLDGIMSFNNKPLRICFSLGGICIAVSLVYLIITLIQIIIGGVTVPGYFTIIFAVLVIGGVQLLSIGVLGEYIGRVYYEVKKRPHYLVDETNADETKVRTRTVSDNKTAGTQAAAGTRPEEARTEARHVRPEISIIPDQKRNGKD